MPTKTVKKNKIAIPKDFKSLIVRPHVTEKAGMMAESNVYTFDVLDTATKQSIMRGIKELYNVTPKKVCIVNMGSKKVFMRGKVGAKKGGKKAYVYLNKGEKIELI